MGFWSIPQLLRLRRQRDWTKDCKGGRKPRFTPFDVVRRDLEQEIWFEEYVAVLASKMWTFR